MKSRLFWVAIASFFIACFINIGVVCATPNDFIIRDFQADYYLNKDSEGRSTLKTVEQITAEFPSYDQNHGIERAIPSTYDGHSVSLDVQSVTDNNDVALNYTTYDSNGNLVLRIGDADTYVHGLVKYKITYTQRDVTKFFTNTNDDEFYWDVNGTEWSQRFDIVTARLHIADGLAGSLNDNNSCYYGRYGGSSLCQITKTDGEIMTTVSNLGVGQNVTISIGFNPKTFSGFVESASAKLIKLLIFIYGIFCILATITIIILLIGMFWLRAKKGKGAPGRGIIVAEYLPPKNVDVALSSAIIKSESTWIAATFVDLAVRHGIKIVENKKGIFKKSVYSLQYVSNTGLTATEQSVVDALFGTASIKTTRELDPKSPDYDLSAELQAIYRGANASAKADGYYEDNKKLGSTMNRMLIALTILGILSIFSIFGFVVGILGTTIGAFVKAETKPLSVKGRELLDYLEGLKLYIKVAEEDRIKMLQSPQGANKVSIDIGDSAKMVELYEKVLPYAVLFGNEKEWAKVLGKFYDQQGMQPSWFSGSDMFNAVLFSSALSSFSSNATASSYSSPSSSSSGGSGGGGFSGGGGGGGGGGGW